MSIIFFLLLLLGFFSLLACDARTLGAAVVRHTITKETDEKLNPVARVSTPSRPNDANVEQDDDPDEAKSESVASVRWRVPHQKKGDAEPGFNLDYLPPKTHPPVHN